MYNVILQLATCSKGLPQLKKKSFCSDAHFSCQNGKINGPKIVSLIYIVFNYARGTTEAAKETE